MGIILNKLKGGDLRSIGRSNEVVEDILAAPDLFNEVLEGIFDTDPVVRARSADALEKVSKIHPEYLQPHKKKLFEAAKIKQQEVEWHVAQMLSYIKLNKKEEEEAIRILEQWLDSSKSNIVRVMSLQTFADISRNNPELKNYVSQKAEELLSSGTPSLSSRARKIIKQLQKS